MQGIPLSASHVATNVELPPSLGGAHYLTRTDVLGERVLKFGEQF